jgi:hypothetical protein
MPLAGSNDKNQGKAEAERLRSANYPENFSLLGERPAKIIRGSPEQTGEECNEGSHWTDDSGGLRPGAPNPRTGLQFLVLGHAKTGRASHFRRSPKSAP